MVQEIKLNQIDSVVTTVGTPWTDGNLPTEKAVRDAIIAASTWGSAWVVPNRFESFTAWETISIWEHVSKYWDWDNFRPAGLPLYMKQVNRLTVLTNAWTNNAPSTPSNINTWQAFTFWVNNKVKRVTYILVLDQWGVANQMIRNLTAKIYAATWVVGSTAVPTWAALFTSNVNAWSTTSTWSTSIFLSFDFTNANLSAGDYCISIEWVLSKNAWAYAQIGMRGGTGHYGNGYNNGAAIANDLYCTVELEWYVLKSQANSSTRYKYLGQATTASTVNNAITVQTRWSITQSWAADDWASWYVSNTLWTLSTTPWTLKIFAGKWVWTNQVGISMLPDLYGNSILSTQTQLVSWTIYYTKSGWLMSAYIQYQGSFANGDITVTISLDNSIYNKSDVEVPPETTWTTVSSTVVIPANCFFVVTLNANVSVIASNIWFIPF